MAIKPSVYVLGTAPPVLKTDAGAGAWGLQDKEVGMVVLKALLTGKVDDVPTWVKVTLFAPLLAVKLTGLTIQAGASFFGGDDAVKHLLHYLGNTGKTYTIDFEGMIKEVNLAKDVRDAQIEAAKKFVQSLPPGKHSFTSTTGSLNHYIHQGLSKNWFFAVGSYTSWGKGSATVSVGLGKMSYSMDYEYNFFDRYNWDGGKQVQIPIPGYDKLPGMLQDLVNKLPNVSMGRLTVTDEFMAKFHRQGLAKEFNMVAMLKIPVSWQVSTPFATYKVKPGDTLTEIARLYYGDAMKWKRIYDANKSAIANPKTLRISEELRIPIN